MHDIYFTAVINDQHLDSGGILGLLAAIPKPRTKWCFWAREPNGHFRRRRIRFYHCIFGTDLMLVMYVYWYLLFPRTERVFS